MIHRGVTMMGKFDEEDHAEEVPNAALVTYITFIPPFGFHVYVLFPGILQDAPLSQSRNILIVLVSKNMAPHEQEN